jgi:hypothetical protein
MYIHINTLIYRCTHIIMYIYRAGRSQVPPQYTHLEIKLAGVIISIYVYMDR